jgi:tetratricopeptide (TPR) repeat protein
MKRMAASVLMGLFLSVSAFSQEAAAVQPVSPTAQAAATVKPNMKDARMLLNKGQFSESLEMYKAVGPLKSKMAESWRLNNMGLCSIKLGNYQDAIQPLEASVLADPKNHVAWNNLGVAFENTGAKDKAIEAYSKGVEAAKAAGSSSEKSEANLKLVQAKTGNGGISATAEAASNTAPARSGK